MTEQPNTLPPFAYRIRGKSGPLAGKWLWAMSASKGGLPMQVMNWPNVVRNVREYQFHPQFLDQESAATRISLETAHAYLIALMTLGIHAEIVEPE
jgi:hypothetical protein